MNRIDSFFPYFGIALDNKSQKKNSLKLKGEKIDIQFYQVIKVEKETFFYKMGVKPGDSLGILSDMYENLTRYIQVIHLPQDKLLKELKNLSDYIYKVKGYKYNENIL